MPDISVSFSLGSKQIFKLSNLGASNEILLSVNFDKLSVGIDSIRRVQVLHKKYLEGGGWILSGTLHNCALCRASWRVCDIVPLARNVSFWIQELIHNISFWIQKIF